MPILVLKQDKMIHFHLEGCIMRGLVERSLFVVAVCGVAFLGWRGSWVDATPPAKDDPAVERARQTVRMLDDIYKTAVVLITDKYVHGEGDFPAGSAAIALFDAVQQKGWHKVRLIDVTGEPYDDKNVAQSAFEKDAVLRLKKGETFVEEIAEVEGKPVLNVATPVPVVLEKCVMCHAHYKDAAPGAAIGAIVYQLPIDNSGR